MVIKFIIIAFIFAASFYLAGAFIEFDLFWVSKIHADPEDRAMLLVVWIVVTWILVAFL
jgi:hypothetical protein